MKFFTFLLAFILIASVSFSQSFFSRLPKQNKPAGFMSHESIFTGTDKWLFRPTVTLASYSIPGNQLSTGIGVTEELVHQDPTTQVYNSVVSISALINYNLPLTPESKPGAPIGGSLFVGFANNHILVGFMYDGKPHLEIGTAINFLN